MNEKLFSLIILESHGLKSKIRMGRNKFFDLFFMDIPLNLLYYPFLI